MNIFSKYVNTMNLDLREISRRLNFFIDVCYKGNGSDFAKASGTTEGTISRIRSGKDTTVSTLLKFRDAGLSSAWIFSETAPPPSMYSETKAGGSLKKRVGELKIPTKYKSLKKGELFILRAEEWISKNYKSITTFHNKYGTNFDFTENDIKNIFDFKEPPTFLFWDMLTAAGCPREYLEEGNADNQANDNETKNLEQMIYEAVKKALAEKQD
jgi:hypothetical protein